MTTLSAYFDLVTALLWFLMALFGIVLRVRRLIRQRRIVLPDPTDAKDRRYLATVKRSTYLRFGTKAVFLLGSLIALFGLDFLWPLWRVGIIVALFFMLLETTGVDRVRDQLGRHQENEA